LATMIAAAALPPAYSRVKNRSCTHLQAFQDEPGDIVEPATGACKTLEQLGNIDEPHARVACRRSCDFSRAVAALSPYRGRPHQALLPHTSPRVRAGISGVTHADHRIAHRRVQDVRLIYRQPDALQRRREQAVKCLVHYRPGVGSGQDQVGCSLSHDSIGDLPCLQRIRDDD